MSTITPLSNEQAGHSRPILEAVESKLGRVPNLFRSIAHSPAALQAYLGFNETLAGGQFTPAEREQIAIAVAGQNQCDYCASAHTAVARGAGVDAEEARRNLDGEASQPKMQAILQFAQTVVDKRGWADEGDVSALRSAGVSDTELVEIIALIAINVFTNYFNHINGTDVDFPLVQARATTQAA